ncbi:hypothetical protein [Muricoccus radiodurans]|uniref:hypothetical protein n=1 Tax=Muricoccus radiodurans TaxID=2231721 RepID=UPI003CF6D5BA
MRRPRAITLVLLGTAAVALGACDSREARCRRARMEGRLDAERICATGSSYSSSGGHGSSWFGWSSSSGGTGSGTVAGSSSRGGFGSTASAHGAGS